MASRVYSVQLSTALRDQETETDAACTMSFAEIPNVTRFRVTHVSLPLSQYTFNTSNSTLHWDFEIPATETFHPDDDDHIDIYISLVNSFGNTPTTFTWYWQSEFWATGDITNKLWITPTRTNTQAWNEILAEINGYAPPGVSLVYDEPTQRIRLVAAPVSVGGQIFQFNIDSGNLLGIPGQLRCLRSPGLPQQNTGAVTANFSAQQLTYRVEDSAGTFFRFVPNKTIVYTASQLAADLNAAIASSYTGNSFTKPRPWFDYSPAGELTFKTNNIYLGISSISPRMLSILGSQWDAPANISPVTFEDVGGTTPNFAVTPMGLNFTPTGNEWSHMVTNFDTDVLYTQTALTDFLTAQFTSLGSIAIGAVWSEQSNRLRITNGPHRRIRVYGNEVLGLRTPPDILLVPNQVFTSPFAFDISGGSDVLYLGLPSLFQDGRTSQGFGDMAKIRRRDIVCSLTNTTGVAWGTYLVFYNQADLFYPLGGTQSISNVKIQLYDQRFNALTTTNSLPINIGIEFL
jgi:hypothetical protein